MAHTAVKIQKKSAHTAEKIQKNFHAYFNPAGSSEYRAPIIDPDTPLLDPQPAGYTPHTSGLSYTSITHTASKIHKSFLSYFNSEHSSTVDTKESRNQFRAPIIDPTVPSLVPRPAGWEPSTTTHKSTYFSAIRNKSGHFFKAYKNWDRKYSNPVHEH